VIIPIDDKQRISSNVYSWDLEVLITPKKADKEPYWKKVKFFVSFRSALTEACQREIRLNPSVGLADCLDAARELTEKYQNIFDATLVEK
jgi:hypothetical protein